MRCFQCLHAMTRTYETQTGRTITSSPGECALSFAYVKLCSLLPWTSCACSNLHPFVASAYSQVGRKAREADAKEGLALAAKASLDIPILPKDVADEAAAAAVRFRARKGTRWPPSPFYARLLAHSARPLVKVRDNPTKARPHKK